MIIVVAALCFVIGCVVEHYLNASNLHSAKTNADSYKHKYESLKELQKKDTEDITDLQLEVEQAQEDYNTLFNTSEDKINELNEEIDLLKEKLGGYESQDKIQKLQQIVDLASEIHDLIEQEEDDKHWDKYGKAEDDV